jgi:N-methylhydantoinase B
MRHDPITTEIIGNHLLSVAEEMTAALIRSAYSANIKERQDCSSAILSDKGEVVAEAAHSPIHIGGIRGAARSLLQHFPDGEMNPGDVFATNDPFLSDAIHLNDITIAAPVFDQHRLMALVACVAHHADIGGMVPGGESCDSRSIYHEGLRLPPIRVFEQGTPVESVVNILAANSRNPVETKGDFRAQFAAVRLGVRRIEEVAEKYSAEVVRASATALLDACERRFRDVVDNLPDGIYEGTEEVDDDWVTGNPFQIKARLEIRGKEVHVDLLDNIDQLETSRNVTAGMLSATVLFGLKAALDPDLPPNSGYGRAIKISSREGSIFNPLPPAAVALGSNTCQYLLGAIFQALARLVPEQICAGSNVQTGIQLFGRNSRTDRPFLNYERVGGGLGARKQKDGLDGVQVGITNTSNLPIEAAEAEYPLRYERYELVPDSGGAGCFRGGLGVRREFKVLIHEAVLTAQSGRRIKPPPGIFGGEPGSCGSLVLNPEQPDKRQLPIAFTDLPLKKNDVVRIVTAGGGGFGKPFERNPLLVRDDVITGRVTIEAARSRYGVALTRSSKGLEVDPIGTTELRAQE